MAKKKLTKERLRRFIEDGEGFGPAGVGTPEYDRGFEDGKAGRPIEVGATEAYVNGHENGSAFRLSNQNSSSADER
jgi:hypothetical protein